MRKKSNNGSGLVTVMLFKLLCYGNFAAFFAGDANDNQGMIKLSFIDWLLNYSLLESYVNIAKCNFDRNYEHEQTNNYQTDLENPCMIHTIREGHQIS